MLFVKKSPYYAVGSSMNSEIEERYKKEYEKRVRELSRIVINQLRISKLSPSLLKSVCGIRSDTMLKSISEYIEEHTRYRIVINSRGLVELRLQKKKLLQKKADTHKKTETHKTYDHDSQTMRIEYPERFIDDPKRYSDDSLFRKNKENTKPTSVPKMEFRNGFCI